MLRLLTARGYGPLGVEIGSRSVKLLQLNAERTRVLDAVRRELPPAGDAAGRKTALVEALRACREGRNFRGREAIISVGIRELYLQNVRLPKATPDETLRLVQLEVANRLPYPIAEAELRYLEAADVRQGESIKREIIALACHRPALDALLSAVTEAGLKPIAVDPEPLALLRCYAQQFRRDEDRQQRAMFVHVGTSHTVVVIARGADPLFIKYIELGGRHFDEAVANHLSMELAAAAALRRHNGDRRADQQDPEISRSVQESVRPVLEKLAAELSMCVRYHSVTFRGQPLVRAVVGGGEAHAALIDHLTHRLDVKCELGDPLRNCELAIQTGRRAQWDIAFGMALRDRSASAKAE